MRREASFGCDVASNPPRRLASSSRLVAQPGRVAGGPGRSWSVLSAWSVLCGSGRTFQPCRDEIRDGRVRFGMVPAALPLRGDARPSHRVHDRLVARDPKPRWPRCQGRRPWLRFPLPHRPFMSASSRPVIAIGRRRAPRRESRRDRRPSASPNRRCPRPRPSRWRWGSCSRCCAPTRCSTTPRAGRRWSGSPIRARPRAVGRPGARRRRLRVQRAAQSSELRRRALTDLDAILGSLRP
jgi:hypothetical protein